MERCVVSDSDCVVSSSEARRVILRKHELPETQRSVRSTEPERVSQRCPRLRAVKLL